MKYRNVISAVIRALACETMTAGAGYEPRVQSAPVPGEIGGAQGRYLMDCMVHAVLHRELSPEHWRVLVAKYSTHAERKASAASELHHMISSPAQGMFLQFACLTWAYPRTAGADGKRSTSVLDDSVYEIGWWCTGVPRSTMYRWRAGIRRQLDRHVDEALMAAQEVLDKEGLLPGYGACKE